MNFGSNSKMRGYIYVITNTINNKIYMGQTTRSFEKRLDEHRRNGTAHFRNAIKKYGIANFTIECVEHYDTEDELKLKCWLNETEIAYIKLFNTTNRDIGYNMTTGGDGFSGLTHTDEAKRKMSESQKARWTDATKILLSEL